MSMNALAPGLSLAYTDPETYLVQPHLHLTARFAAPFLPSDAPLQRVTYASVGDPTGPLLLLINGMGGSRLFGWSLDGIAEQHRVNVVTFDRPSSGGSTACDLAHRVEWTHHAILAILAALPSRPTSFSILSHSNGLIYALYTLLHLPAHLSVKSWALTSPYIGPWASGSVPLTLARMLPAQATAQFGLLAGAVLRTVGPIGNIGSWSAGFARASSGLSGVVASLSATPEDAPAPADTPERELARFKFRNAARPAHRRLFGRYYYSQACVELVQKFTLAEGTDALGPEALLSFRLAEGGDAWGWGGPEGEEEAPGAELSALYERGFEALGRRMEARGEAVRIQVVFGAQDGLVPKQGRDYLRALLVDKLGFVVEEDWMEVDDVGHDEVLGLEIVADLVLEVAHNSLAL